MLPSIVWSCVGERPQRAGQIEGIETMPTAVHSTKPVSKRVGPAASVLLLLAVASLSLAGCAGLVGGASNNNNPPPASLTISSVQSTGITTTGFQVSWTTNSPANSAMDYGTTSSYGSSLPVNSSMVTAHKMSLSGLKAGTLYHYRVRSAES